MGQVTVVGAGVSGLSCAIELLKRGHEVSVVTRQLPGRTTSAVATAMWHIFLVEVDSRVIRWGRETLQELLHLCKNPSTGAILRRGFEFFRHPPREPSWSASIPCFRWLASEELPLSDYTAGYEVTVPVADMSIYLPWLQGSFSSLGGVLAVRHVHELEELRDEIIVNCAGLGARELVGDATLIPVKGQIVRVTNPGNIDTYMADDENPRGMTYIIPRIHDVILGGSAERGEEDPTPDPSLSRSIRERCEEMNPSIRSAQWLADAAGLRPYRPSIRLETTHLADGRAVVHNYGHGGSGFSLSWGCAAEVARLVEAALGSSAKDHSNRC